MSMGFNWELLFASGIKDTIDGVQLNAHELYDLITARVNDVLAALYEELGFPQKTP